jgi:hypothetical protein
MKLYRNTITGWRYKGWSLLETIAYFIKGIARELKIAPNFFLKWHETIAINRFKKKWLKTKNNISFFDFNGAKLPDVSDNADNLKALVFPIFLDTFLFYCYYNDDYSKDRVLQLDPYMSDGVYGYTELMENGRFILYKKDWDIANVKLIFQSIQEPAREAQWQ